MEVQDNSWFIIINPVAGSGASVQAWKQLKPILEQANIDFQFALTKHPTHAVSLSKKVVAAGGRRILIMGGDGTANEVLNGLFLSGVATDEVVLGMISGGTGNDWVRTIGRHGALQQIPRSLRAADTVAYDAGELTFTKEGATSKRYFLNITGLGFDGFVTRELAFGKGFLSNTRYRYWAALLKGVLRYKPNILNFVIDDVPFSYTCMSVAAGIGKYNGGGMKQLPFADYNDGKLDLTLITTVSKFKMIWSLPKLKRGTFTGMHQVKTFQAVEIKIDSEEEVFVEADGEYLGTTPASITIIPDALRILRWK